MVQFFEITCFLVQVTPNLLVYYLCTMERSREEFYKDLKEKLKENTKFPSVYLFKFIIPNNNQKLAQTQALFGPEAQVTTRKSRNGNYLSVSAKEMMLSAQGIIDRYKKAEKIEGIIQL